MHSYILSAVIWLVLMTGFAVYLNILAKKFNENKVLWTILGFIFTALAVSILMYKHGRKVYAVIWLVIWIAGLESFIISVSGMLSTFMPNLEVEL